MIKIVNINKKFAENKVLDEISLELHEGNIYGFVGRNGCGKSILFKAICGFCEPDSGEVLINGENIYEKHIFPKDTAALIEYPKFLPKYTGFENLKMLASIKNKITEKEILNTLDSVGLISEKDKIFKNYSVGMKQKLGIAQALMEDDKIIILDEPFTGLDDKSVNDIRKLLLKEKKKGKLILISSHIKEDINILCDVVYKIDGGKVYEIKNN